MEELRTRAAAARAPGAGEPTRFLIAFEVDNAGLVTRWTAGAAEVLGMPASATVGHDPPVPAPWPGGGAWSDARSTDHTLLDQPMTWPVASGGQVEVTVSTTPTVGPDGATTGLLVSARDISARRLLEAQLSVYARDIRESYGRELHSLAELEVSYRATVEALAVGVEAKDDTTGGHIRRVCRLGLLLASAHLGDEAADAQLEFGFLLHDVGKLAVPDAVLNKPGPLNDAEWVLMRRHPEEGARILAEVPFLNRAIDIVRYHHERWDGTGYPVGLRGDAIPIGARIFAIADTVDAMTSDRPYRKGGTLEAALAELERESGHQFDPACVATFAGLAPELIQTMLEQREGP